MLFYGSMALQAVKKYFLKFLIDGKTIQVRIYHPSEVT